MKLARVYQRHGAYYYVDAQRTWHHLGRTLPEALRCYAEILERGTESEAGEPGTSEHRPGDEDGCQ